MNSRRFMTGIGLAPPRAVGLPRTLSLARRDWAVLGVGPAGETLRDQWLRHPFAHRLDHGDDANCEGFQERPAEAYLTGAARIPVAGEYLEPCEIANIATV